MSTCERCGATFDCAMAGEGVAARPCWCTLLPPAVPVPRQADQASAPSVGCWCPACLKAHIAAGQASKGR